MSRNQVHKKTLLLSEISAADFTDFVIVDTVHLYQESFEVNQGVMALNMFPKEEIPVTDMTIDHSIYQDKYKNFFTLFNSGKILMNDCSSHHCIFVASAPVVTNLSARSLSTTYKHQKLAYGNNSLKSFLLFMPRYFRRRDSFFDAILPFCASCISTR